jgi:hypothetical protein
MSEIACLENHGDSLADAALRSRAPGLCPSLAAPFRRPDEGWCGDGNLSGPIKSSHRRRILRDVILYPTGCAIRRPCAQPAVRTPERCALRSDDTGAV